ncbi:hypothetical protein FRC19_003152 [Serendipita sp. 401]|nr:hypothetical protein FRC19_003152 [Serendipita sp. 401]
MAKRLYVGKLPHDVPADEVRNYFESEARVKVMDCRIMTGFGFVEFETLEDAENAVRLDGRDFHGAPLVIQFARENKPRREPPRDMRSRFMAPNYLMLV